MGEGDRGQLVKSDAAKESTALVGARDSSVVLHEGEDPEIVRLRSEIEATRERIRSSLDHLHDEVEEKLDWHRYVREHPWRVVGVAFAVGFFFGSG